MMIDLGSVLDDKHAANRGPCLFCRPKIKLFHSFCLLIFRAMIHEHSLHLLMQPCLHKIGQRSSC